MKPNRNFRLRGKKELFAVVGFRYDRPSSILYSQFKDSESVGRNVLRLLGEPNNADIISIRRVYLDNDEIVETDDLKESPILESIKA